MTHDYSDRVATDAEAARRWAADAELREEFGGRFEAYRAYARAVAEGRVQMHGRRGVVRGAEIARSGPAAAGSGAGIAATRAVGSASCARYQPGGDLYIAATRRAHGS